MVMEIVAEELDVGDRRIRDDCVSEMAGKEDEGDIADGVGIVQPRQVSDFKRGLARGIEDLRSALDCGQPPSVHKLLHGEATLNDCGRKEREGTNLEEDFSEYTIGLLPEHGREDDGDAVG